MNPTRPEVEVVGEVYNFRWPDAGVQIIVDRFSQDMRAQTVTAELAVSLDPRIHPDITSKHLHHARLNLTASRSKNELAKVIQERRNSVDWQTIVEQVSVIALQRYRQGEPVVSIGNTPIDQDRPTYQLYPILRKDQPTIIFGRGGLGKSLLGGFFSLLIQSGIDMEGFRPEKANVLYLDYEDDSGETNDRLQAFKAGIGSVVRGTEVLYRYCHQPLHYDAGALQRIKAEHDIGMVVVDSLGGATAGQVNDPEVNTKAFNTLRALKVTSLIIDHVSKADDGKGPIGSVFKYNRARSVWEVKSAQQPGEEETNLGLYHRKVNRGKLLRPFGLRMEFVGDDPTTAILTSSVKVEDVPELEIELPLAERIWAILAGQALTSEEVWQAVNTGEGAGRASLETVRVTLSRNKTRFIHAEGHWERLIQ